VITAGSGVLVPSTRSVKVAAVMLDSSIATENVPVTAEVSATPVAADVGTVLVTVGGEPVADVVVKVKLGESVVLPAEPLLRTR
jgi:hypothetical protein